MPCGIAYKFSPKSHMSYELRDDNRLNFSWTGHSTTTFHIAETQVLSKCRTNYKRFYVNIGPVVGPSDEIWTLTMNDRSPGIPMVMLHGMGAGIAFWCLNLDAFSADRPIYAIDVLGFGRSSRPTFSTDPDEVEKQYVASIEAWRKKICLEKFILLGHSMGGYLSTLYSMKYPERVHHLILADPWGFPDRPKNGYHSLQYPRMRVYTLYALEAFNPLAMLRLMGPAGQWFIRRSRHDLVRKFDEHVYNAEKNIPTYIQQCNSRNPSGETAFRTMMDGFGWSKNPMIHRVGVVPKDLPITFLFGSLSWVDSSTGIKFQEVRPPGSYTESKVIEEVGHHIFLDRPKAFNDLVLEACRYTDEKVNGSSRKQSNRKSSQSKQFIVRI